MRLLLDEPVPAGLKRHQIPIAVVVLDALSNELGFRPPLLPKLMHALTSLKPNASSRFIAWRDKV
jgi:hypothetical protein